MAHPAQHQSVAIEIDWDPQMAGVFQEVYDRLERGGQIEFQQEVSDAVLEMMRRGDSRALNDTLQAWYRTLVLKRAGVDLEGETIDIRPDQAMDVEQVRAYLGL